MNQAELINIILLHPKNTTSKASVKFVLDTLADVIRGELQQGVEVTIPGIGKLSVETRAARQGRNPNTGESIDIAAKRVPKFSATKVLKDAVA